MTKFNLPWLPSANSAANAAAGDAARDAGVACVAGANRSWVDRAVAVIRALPTGANFTTDIVWARVKGGTTDPRAMGAAVIQARAEGLIESTGEYERSGRPACHSRPVAVWRRK